jgi:hypothetical protein
MADYHPLIARAVAGLDKNTGDARRSLYERARSALLAQLRNSDPPLSESEITRERLALEEAIRKVEAEAARQNRLESRAEPKPKVRAPAPAKWEELARPPAGSVPSPAPSVPSGRRESVYVSPPPEVPPPPRRPRPPSPGLSTEQRNSNTVFDEPLPGDRTEPPPLRGPDPPPAASATPSRTPRPRVGIERRTAPEAGLKSLGNMVAEAGELGAAPARAARSAREAKAIIAPAEEPEAHEAEQETQPIDEFAPDMLESSFAADDSRPRPPGGRAASDEDEDDEIVTRPPRSYRGLIKIGVPLVVLLALGGAFASQWRSVVDVYRSFRVPAAEAAKDPASPALTSATTPKIAERFMPGQQQQQPQQQQQAAPGQQQQAVVAPPPPAASAPQAAVAQRVVLYEEDPSDPQGKQFVGSAVWRTEVVSPAPKAAPELAIRADIDVPERRLGVTWVLRRNTDQVLPASHTIEITFKLPPDFPSGGISNVPGILMKPAEQTRGTPLAGSAAKVTNGYFLIGLSAMDTEKDRNIQMLKDRAWLDIPLVYNNGRRAILAVEKGTAGERAFNDAFKAWSTTTTTAK